MADENKVAADLQRAAVASRQFAQKHQLWGNKLMLSSLLWVGQHWGFVSFSAPILHEREELSFTEIGSFVPLFAFAYIVAVGLLGLRAERVSQVALLAGGNLLIAAGSALVLSGVYWVMLLGMVVIAMGYSPWTIVTYVQIKLLCGKDHARYTAWYMWKEGLSVVGFSLGRFLMVLSVTYVAEDSWWLWRLPWVICIGMNCVHALLLVLFGHLPPPVDDKNNSNSSSSHSLTTVANNKAAVRTEQSDYVAKLRVFWCNPVAVLMLVGNMLSAYCSAAIAAWAPTIALERFQFDRSSREINFTILFCLLAAWPAGMFLWAYTIKHSHNIKSAVRNTFVFVLLAAVALLVYAQQKDSFAAHLIMLIIFSGVGNFPFVFFKQLPEVLGLPEEVKVFALSRFTIVYTVFGNMISVFVTGVTIDGWGVDDALTLLYVVAFCSAGVWAVLSLWSLVPTGPIEKRSVQQATQDRALRNWKLLNATVLKKAKTSRILADALYIGQASTVMGWLLRNHADDDVVAHVDADADVNANMAASSSVASLGLTLVPQGHDDDETPTNGAGVGNAQPTSTSNGVVGSSSKHIARATDTAEVQVQVALQARAVELARSSSSSSRRSQQPPQQTPVDYSTIGRESALKSGRPRPNFDATDT